MFTAEQVGVTQLTGVSGSPKAANLFFIHNFLKILL